MRFCKFDLYFLANIVTFGGFKTLQKFLKTLQEFI